MALGRSMPGAPARQEVDAALHSDSEQVQACALKVLAQLRDAPAIAALKSWLEQALGGERDSAALLVGIEALRGCLPEGEAAWALDAYFTARSSYRRCAMLRLVADLPRTMLEQRIAAEEGSADPDRQQAAQMLLCILDRGAQA